MSKNLELSIEEVYSKNAIWDKNHYKYFGIQPKSAFMYGCKEEEIQEINFKISNNQIKPKANEKNMEPDSWGRYDYERKEFSLIFPKHFLLNMCFPYGMKVEEERDRGKAYRIEIQNHP